MKRKILLVIVQFIIEVFSCFLLIGCERKISQNETIQSSESEMVVNPNCFAPSTSGSMYVADLATGIYTISNGTVSPVVNSDEMD